MFSYAKRVTISGSLNMHAVMKLRYFAQGKSLSPVRKDAPAATKPMKMQ